MQHLTEEEDEEDEEDELLLKAIEEFKKQGIHGKLLFCDTCSDNFDLSFTVFYA